MWVVSLSALALALGAAWGARRAARPSTRRTLGAAVLAGLGVGVASGWVAWREARAVDELGAVIAPFPGIMRARWAPGGGRGERSWLFETPASAAEVQSFYHGEASRGGWRIREDSGRHMVLERGPVRVDLSIHPEGPGRTVLLYVVTGEGGR